jgi:hypothetical protein
VIPKDGKYRVTHVKPLRLAYHFPQFGVNIMSTTRLMMHNIIDKCAANGITVLHANTDSLVIPEDKVEAANALFDNVLIGTGLGQFSSELSSPGRLFIGLSPKRYLIVCKDGKIKARYAPKDYDESEYERWFEWKWTQAQ